MEKAIQPAQNPLFERIASVIDAARQRVKTTVNTAMVYTYYSIGQHIVEAEQQGELRADYGKEILKNLSARLTERYGAGWSYANLKNVRQFYLIYSEDVVSGIGQPAEKAKQCLANLRSSGAPLARTSEARTEFVRAFTLSWSHYLILMRIKNPQERRFYEIECAQQDWSIRQLQRQVASSLHERLAAAMKKLLSLAATLLLASCSFFAEPTLEEFAARVPAYDDATPVNHYALKDYKTIGEVRRALDDGSLKANGSNAGFWNISYGTTWGTEEMFSQKELSTQRLALLHLMLSFGGDPQKVDPCGDEEERGIAYALLINRGLHADEPFTRLPESIEKYGHEDERYPLTQLALLPDSVIRWLVENGAPLNETFDGKTELMRLFDNLWGNVVAEEFALSISRLKEQAEEADEEWEKAYRVTEYLLAQGLDPCVKDDQGYCAIDHIPFVCPPGQELADEKVSAATLERARKLAQLLLDHGSPARRAPATSGRESALMAHGLMTISWVDGALEDMAAARKERARQEHEEREARLAPLRAKRRAAEAEKQTRENAAVEPW